MILKKKYILEIYLIGINTLKIKEQDLEKVNGGGFSLRAAMVTAVFSGLRFIFDIGKTAGSSFRRSISGNYCSFR